MEEKSRSKSLRQLIILLLLLVLIINCTSCKKEKQLNETVELTVLAAASLTEVTQALATEFTKKNPEINLVFSYGSSGALQTQIEEGVKADLFLSAGKKQMSALIDKGLILQDSAKDLLLNNLVLIVPSDKADNPIKTFEDLGKANVNMIAMGDPAGVPVGQYTQQVFENLGIWDNIQTKVNYGSDVRQVLTWVETGEADCGVVYSTDTVNAEKVVVVSQAPEGTHDPIIYPIGIISSTTHKDAAQTYLDFLSGTEAKTIFETFGFTMIYR